MAFNPSQEEAVSHTGGPMMVLAGPGSGKTTVITHRTRNLIRRGVDPGQILVITFTRAAAREMEERFSVLTEGKSTRVSFGTFHSVFFTILKYAYRYKASDIVREEQKMGYIREMIGEYGLEIEDEHEFIPAVLGEISLVKSEMMNLDHYYSRNCSEEVFKKLYRGYEERMRRAGLLDFDDMLVMCHELFTQRKDILRAWQNKFRYILIDEFQDINRVQYEIVKMLALPENNLFIVGDDDQSVYRFRGARPEIMLGFTRDYPQARTVLLGVNYRSTREIVEAASALIGHNTKRYEKKLTAARGAGKPVVTCMSTDPQEETLRIVEEIQDYVMQGGTAAEFLKKLYDMVDFLIPNYILEGKNQLVVAVGCTGGKHRSVTIANALYAYLEGQQTFGVKIEHRDIENDRKPSYRPYRHHQE